MAHNKIQYEEHAKEHLIIILRERDSEIHALRENLFNSVAQLQIIILDLMKIQHGDN